MKKYRSGRIMALAVLALMLIPWLGWTEGGTVPQLDGVVDLAGTVVNPFAKEDQTTANVFLFVAVDCPISNKYIPEVKRLVNEFAPRGVRFWLVYPDPETPTEAIRKHAQDFGFVGKVISDRKQALVRKSQVKVTPEAALFSPTGEMIYHGRIDDRFPALGVERAQPMDRTLAVALTSFLSGRSVPIKITQAIGCPISTTP
jgi:hypothetical protein